MDSGNEKYPEVYFCIDQRSFYASVECVLRGLDPMTALLVVADAERSKNTICLAVSVGCKKKGIKNRCCLGDVPPNMGVIVAPPQMQLYIDSAAEIHGVFLKYFAPEDIYVYSIDESFIYVTPYLRMYHLTPRELAAKVIADIRNTVGTLSTCGIGSNLYLAKVALDIQAKHAPDGIAELTQRSYQEQLWQHQPLTDFWRVGSGTANRLRNRGITTMQGITESDPDSLYNLFGINAELLIDHAWGRESCTIADIKAYKSSSKSLSSSQVLMRDYKPEEAIVVAKEMADQLCLDMAAKQYLTESVCLYIGYSYTQGVPGTGGTASLAFGTNLSSVIVPAVDVLYRRIVRQGFAIRQIGLSCPVYPDTGAYQLNMFEDTQKQLRGKALQETLLGIRSKKALRRLNDTICVENGYSIVENPKGKGKSYDKWLGDQKKPSHRERICYAIDEALAQNPQSFEDLLELVQRSGYEVKGGKVPALLGEGQKRFIRMDTLGAGYTPDDLRAIIAGTKAHTPKKKRVMDAPAKPSGCLLIDIQAKLQEGKGAGYARWAKNFNLKQLSQTLIYLEENNLLDRSALEERTAAATAQYHTLSAKMKSAEQRMAEIKGSLAKRDRLLSEGNWEDASFCCARQFAEADCIVIAAPYWDFGFPALLKIYLERVTVAGITFCYDSNRPKGLCRAKKLFYITTAGGPILCDFGYPYVKSLAQNLYGIADTICIRAENLDIDGADITGILKRTKQEIANELGRISQCGQEGN